MIRNPFTELSLDDLRQRSSIKWQRHPSDVLPLWVAEMDVLLAEPVVEAIVRAARLGDTGYPAGTAYAEALSGFAQQRWGWTVDPVRTTIVPDVMNGAVELLTIVTSPGDAVVVNSPVYYPFYAFVQKTGRRVAEAPLDSTHRLDLDAMDRVFAEVTAGGARAAYLLCSPHNPTGTVHTAEELRAVTRLADDHGVRVIADEIHAPIVCDGAGFVPYLSIEGTERAFSLMSASKGWNLAGIKAALAIAGEDAVDDLKHVPYEVREGASHVGVLAHTAALRDGGTWLDAMLLGLDGNRRLLAEVLAQRLPDVRYRPPEGTYLGWLDCRALELGDDPSAVFLERGRVALSSGPLFGTGGAGHARINLATSPTIIEDAVGRMAAAV